MITICPGCHETVDLDPEDAESDDELDRMCSPCRRSPDARPHGLSVEWIDKRWHCEGLPIHAGVEMMIQQQNGFWLPIRIESADYGRRLFAHIDSVAGPSLRAELNPWEHILSWPARHV